MGVQVQILSFPPRRNTMGAKLWEVVKVKATSLWKSHKTECVIVISAVVLILYRGC